MSNVAVEVKVYAGGLQEFSSPVEITGSNLTQTRTLASSSDVLLAGNNCKILLDLVGSNIVANVLVEGKYNVLTVNGGQAKIKIMGKGNTVNAANSKVLSGEISGRSNSIRHAA